MRLKCVLGFITLFALAAWPGVQPACAASPAASGQEKAANPADLRIYVIDVEGGQSTLIVTPARQSLLVDTGWAGFNGRDTERILQAAKLAGIDRINALLITHYHADHVGGVPQLAERIPIDTFFDHGPDVENSPDARKLYAAYLKTAQKGQHRVVKPGGIILLGGVKVVVVAAAGRRLRKPLRGAGQTNPYCSETKPIEPDPSENAQSSGIVLTYGKFRFVDLGDLTWNKEIALMCPVNRLGRADVFLASHHGESISNSKALVWALEPRVTIIDNAAKKGGTPEAWKRIYEAPGRERIWEIHYSVEGGNEANAEPDYIANSVDQPDQGNYIEVSAHPDGGFTVTNSRNGFKVNYPPRSLPAQSITRE
ncbi:MAG: MBL fold metallo-hydrolase [Acidobacteria bacterium]|nr:MAG: MBL fold metallo-hydrolase [Acidobacteriota bacterium]